MPTCDESLQPEEHSKRIYSLLRERLRAYHAYEVPAGGAAQSWIGVAEAIQSVTGVKIPGESLRQIANPKNKKRDQRPRDTDPERWNAIKEFLTHSSIGYVHAIELTKLSLPLHPLFSLREFFGIGRINDTSPIQLEPTGTYFAEVESENGIEEFELIINFDSKTGISEALQVSVLNHLDSNKDSWDRFVLEGFCLYSESGNYLISLRDPLTFQGHFKLVLEANVVEKHTKKENHIVITEKHIQSFLTLENWSWIANSVETGENVSDLSDKQFRITSEKFSDNTLQYFRTDVSNLTLDGEV